MSTIHHSLPPFLKKTAYPIQDTQVPPSTQPNPTSLFHHSILLQHRISNDGATSLTSILEILKSSKTILNQSDSTILNPDNINTLRNILDHLTFVNDRFIYTSFPPEFENFINQLHSEIQFTIQKIHSILHLDPKYTPPPPPQ